MSSPPNDYLENQETITQWQRETFGEASGTLSCLRRFLDEVDELEDSPGAEECADVLITLYRVAESLGVDLHEQVDTKMAINRKRMWVKTGEGHGQHVK